MDADDLRTAREIGRRIFRMRSDAGITQDKLSAISGVDRSYISELESGKCSLSVSVLYRLCTALKVSPAAALEDYEPAPKVRQACFRNGVPLPPNITAIEIGNALQKTQDVFALLKNAAHIDLGSIIQGNNFSGVVSNIFTKMLAESSQYNEFSEQRYPDLKGPDGTGLEVKASVNPWKGGEGHNGHSGWHIVVCYCKISGGQIEFSQVEIAELIGFGLNSSDWKYLGSKRNNNDSQRTETYITTAIGTAKLRDGTLYLREDLAPVRDGMKAARKRVDLRLPSFSPFF